MKWKGPSADALMARLVKEVRCFTQKAAQYPKLGCWAAFVS